MKNILKRATALLLSLLMVFSVCSTSLVIYAQDAATPDVDLSKLLSSLSAESTEKTINYVSIGDSMTNGYGFEGYEQRSTTTDKYDFVEGVGVYGNGSYALQFEEYLAEKYNATINHTKLAPSGLLADNILYLLGVTETDFNDGWNGYLDYVGDYVVNKEPTSELKEHFYNTIENADIMTLCIGNASFGAYLVQKITDAIGIMGAPSEDTSYLTLENGLRLLKNEESKKIVMSIYEDLKLELNTESISTAIGKPADALVDIFAYTVATFLVSYEALLDKIVEINPDIEIVLIGLMNTTYGMVITDEGMEPIPFGDIMDNLFNKLGNYISGLPALRQEMGQWTEAKFYYAAQPKPEFIVQAFDDLADEGWNDIDCGDKDCVECTDKDPDTVCENGRLSGDIVRQRNLDAYNNGLRYAIGSALGFALPAVTIDEVANYEPVGDEGDSYQVTAEFGKQAAQYNETNADALPLVKQYINATNDLHLAQAQSKAGEVFKAEIEKEISIAIYLAIEEAVVDNVDTMEISVGGLMGIAGDIFRALGEMPSELNPQNNPGPVTINNTLVNWFNGTENGRSMCKVYALFKVGNGMSVHPTPTGHDNIFNSVVAAYESDYTVDKELADILAKYDNSIVIKNIYVYLRGNEYLTGGQILEIIDTAWTVYKETGTFDALATVQEVYETILLNKELSDADRIDIIFTVYGILNDAFAFGSIFDSFVKIAKELVANKQIRPLQAFAIVHVVYLAYANNGAIDSTEFRVIANIVYYVILGRPQKVRGGSGINWNEFTLETFQTELGGDMEKLFAAVQQDSAVIGEKSAEEKVEIIKKVVEAVPNDVKESSPEVKAVTNLVTTLTEEDANGESLLSDDQLANIIDSAFDNFVEIKAEPVKIEDAIANITQTVVEELVGMEPEKFEQVMGAIQETVGQLGGTEGEGGEGGSGIVIPEITIPDEVKYANELAYILEQEGLIDAAQRGELVKELTSVLFGKTTDPMDLIDNIYSIIYKEGFDIETTVKFVVVIATFAYEKRDVAFNYANPYYAQAMAQVLTEENIDKAIISIDSAIAAIDSAIAALSGKARANMGDTTALKAALVAELEATKDTLTKIRTILNEGDLKNGEQYEIQATIAALLTFEEDLWAHANNIAKIATEAGIFAMPYIQLALETINHYAGVAAGVAQNAYNWCVANVQGFVENYLALVDTISTEISTKFDPTVGAAVRDFMINTPADALAIIYTAGADAVEKLVDRAVNYGNAVADAAIDLALVIKKYGVAIYNAIVDDPACKALYEELLGVVDQILALEDQIKKPSDIEDVALDIYGKLDKLQAYAIDLAGRFYDAAIAAVKADDYLAGTELEDAINALVAALATIDDETIDYAKWLAQHAGEMGGALLASLLENWDALYTASWPIIKEKAENLYDYVKDYILNYDYEALIQKIIDAAIKIAPEVDEYLYDFFYNNPEQVIEFFKEYGDEIVELFEKYGEFALGVIGVAVITAGPVLVDYIIDNHEAVIAGLNAWANKYGDRVVAILQVYAEALGICDIVREEIADLEAKRDALVAQLKVLNAQLQTAVGEAREAILAEIAKVQAELARVQAKIAELQVKLQAVIDAISNLEEALKKFANEAVATAVAAVTEAIANLNKAVKDLLASVSDNVAVKLEQLLNSGKELTVGLLKDLADLIIETAVKYSPIIDQKLYDYFYNNPEEVIAFFNEYGDDIIELCKKYGDEALAIIGTALYLYGDDLAAYVIENPDEVLAGLNAWADKYGDRVVAILQVYAEALGLCDAVREEIADLEAKRDALVAQLKALNAQLQNAIGEAKKAIEAEIAKVQAELARVQAKLDELNAKLQALVNAIYQLDDALKQFVTDSIENATAAVIAAIDNLNKAVKDLLGSVSDDVAAKLEQLIKTGIGLTKELIADLAKLAVEAVIKFAPELDAYLYDYFYNNPEEVIAFFNEYGDEIIELCKKHGDKALAVVALALAYYGPELAEYIINNPEDVLAGICAWADKYGDRVVAILQVYAEALGLCDAVRGEVDALNDKLAALQAELMKQLNILQNELQAELNDLYAQLKDAVDAQKAIILEKIKEIESKIELVQQYIAELQAKIAELQVMIAELNAKLQALINAIYNLDDALKTLINVGIEAGIAGVQSALNAVAVAIRDLVGVVSGDIAAQIDQLLAKAKDYLNNAYNSAIIADYVIDNMSNYVALGDNKAYADLFAQYLINEVAKADVGYTYKVNTALVQNGSKINTLPVIINTNLNAIAGADLISIGYSFDKIAENTMLMAIELLMDGKTSVPTDFNWSTLVGAEAGAEVEKLVADIYSTMLNEGLGISIAEATGGLFASELLLADVVITAVEYFAYSAIEYAAYLPQAVGMINQINPNAIIMINAISNPISGTKLSFFGQELVFGDYLDYVCDAIYVETAVLATMYENVVFVPTTEVETTLTDYTISMNSSQDLMTLAQLLTALMENQAINTTPNGNAYVCEKMADALNITVKDSALLGDVNHDGEVTLKDALLIARYEIGLTNDLDLTVADVDGDGYIGIKDAFMVARYEIGLVTSFPAAK